MDISSSQIPDIFSEILERRRSDTTWYNLLQISVNFRQSKEKQASIPQNIAIMIKDPGSCLYNLAVLCVLMSHDKLDIELEKSGRFCFHF